MPVLKHYKGVCHVYIDAAVDPVMAERIVVNAKCQRPGVCNAAESLLVHAAVANAVLPRLAAALQQRGESLRLRGRERPVAVDHEPLAADPERGGEQQLGVEPGRLAPRGRQLPAGVRDRLAQRHPGHGR